MKAYLVAFSIAMYKTTLLLLTSWCFIAASGQPLHYYFGNLHAHSDYSDGNIDRSTSGIQTPAKSYAYAAESYHFDFVGISDHNHAEAGMHLASFHKGLHEADSINQTNSDFLALYGMEYGVLSGGGHIVVYGIDSLIGWENNNYDIYNAKTDYAGLYNLVKAHKGSFASFAHPDNGDFNNLVSQPLDSACFYAMQASAVRNGGAYSQTNDYSDAPPATMYYSFFRRLLAKGYYVGPTIDHDNHYTNFGRTAPSRTVVLASTLQKDSVLSALRQRRFYASDDWNTEVHYAIDEHYMGDSFTTGAPATMEVAVADPDNGDTVAEILVHYGKAGSGQLSTVLSRFTNRASFSMTIDPSSSGAWYYFLEITQADGNKIWTSPIWVNRTNSILPLYQVIARARSAVQGIALDAGVISPAGIRKAVWQKSTNGHVFTDIGTLSNAAATANHFAFTDTLPVGGWQYYRLQLTNAAGNISFSNVVSYRYTDQRYRLLSLWPNPVRDRLSLHISAASAAPCTVSIYNAEGRLLWKQEHQLSNGLQTIAIPTQKLARGTYILTIQSPAGREEKRFVKE